MRDRSPAPTTVMAPAAGTDGAVPAKPAVTLRTIAVPLALGLLVRLVIAPFTSWNADMNVWLSAAWSGAYHLPLYARTGFSYPSAWGHVLQIVAQLANALGMPPSSFGTHAAQFAGRANLLGTYVPTPGFDLLIKLPLFACDVATSVVVAALVARVTGEPRLGKRAFVLLFLNPLVIFSSAVSGSFQIAVALAIAAAVYGVVARRYVLTGSAVAVGVLVKIVPGFVLPLVVVAIFFRSGDTMRERMRQSLLPLAKTAVGLLASMFVIILPEILNGSLGTMWHAVSLRETTSTPTTGGFTVYGLGHLRGLEAIQRFLTGHLSLARDLNYACLAAALVIVCVMLARRHGDPGVLITGIVVCFIALFFAAQLAQPLYFVWIMPLLVALRTMRRLPSPLFHLLWLLPILDTLLLFGPAAVLAPLALVTGVPSLADISHWTSNWTNPRPGLVATLAGSDWNTVIICLGLALQLVALWFVGRRLFSGTAVPEASEVAAAAPAPRAEQAGDREPRRTPAWREEATAWYRWVRLRLSGGSSAVGLVTLVFAGVLCSSLAAVDTAGAADLSATIARVRVQDRTLHLALHLSVPPGEQAVRVAAYPVRSGTAVEQILVYSGRSVPVYSGSSKVNSELTNHLLTDFKLHGWKVRVSNVGASGLLEALGSRSGAASTVIVDTTGALPAAAAQSNASLVHRWLREGGTLVWSGYTAGSHDRWLWHGEHPIFLVPHRHSLLQDGLHPGLEAAHATSFGAFLDIGFRSLLFPIRLAAVSETHGIALGWREGGWVSVAAVPVQKGQIVLFGGTATDVIELSSDIGAILMSRADAAIPGFDLGGRLVPVSDLRQGTLSWSAHLPPAVSSNGGLVEVFAVDANPFGLVAASCLVQVGPPGSAARSLGCQPAPPAKR